MKKLIVIFIFALYAFYAKAQQTTFRSSLGAVDHTFNPAMTAVGEYLELNAFYQQQWVGFEGAPYQGAVSFQFPFIYQNMGIGGTIYQKKAGPLINNNAQLSYAYKFQPSLFYKDQLSLGISGEVSLFRFDGTKLIPGEEEDPLLFFTEENGKSPKFGAGFFYVSDKRVYQQNANGFFIGAAANQIFQRELPLIDSDGNLNRVLHANAIVGASFIRNDLVIQPSFWGQFARENLWNIRGDVRLEWMERFWTGISVGTDAAVTLQAGIILSDGIFKDGTFRLGTSVRNQIGVLQQYQGLSYEIMMAYRFEM